MSYNCRQVAGKIETVEGTAESLTATDAKVKAYNPRIEFSPDMFPRNWARNTYSKVGKLTGKRPGSYPFGVELKGSGTATTEPEWSKYLKACGVKISALRSITIGAVSNGPFQHRELITGTNSGATGYVIMATANGTTTLYYVAVGTVNFESAETITGGTSGATATTGSTSSAVGKVWEPLTDQSLVPSLTLAGYESIIGSSSGLKKLLKGCRGSCKFNFKSGEPVMMDFNFMGVEAGITDISLLTGISYETQIPPVLVSAAFSIDSVAAKISMLDIDFGCNLSPRDDVNDSRGLLSFIIGGRDVVGSFDPEMLAVASHDFHSKWFNNTEMALDITIGSTTGNKFRFYAPKVQYTDVKDQDRGGIKIAQTVFDLNQSIAAVGDDEWALLAL